MKVLVLETDRHAADGAIRSLTEAGHEVARCHERDMPAFPCAALCDSGTCPLDDWIDVVLTVRAHPYPRPVATEDGIACALRRHVPLVVAGTSALSPYDRWTTGIVAEDGDIVRACEEAIAQPLRRHSAVATQEATRIVGEAGLPTEGVTAVAMRRPRRLVVDVTVPAEADRRLGDVIAVRVAGMVRAVDDDAGIIDVRVQSA
jgi:hypothetical protein